MKLSTNTSPKGTKQREKRANIYDIDTDSLVHTRTLSLSSKYDLLY